MTEKEIRAKYALTPYRNPWAGAEAIKVDKHNKMVASKLYPIKFAFSTPAQIKRDATKSEEAIELKVLLCS
jgi:hypothetical protein